MGRLTVQLWVAAVAFTDISEATQMLFPPRGPASLTSLASRTDSDIRDPPHSQRRGLGADDAAPSKTPVGELLSFPKGFIWGASTSAYQVEGGAAEGGRGPSVWDRLFHSPPKLLQDLGSPTGDVAADHFHRFRDDVSLMARLGLKAYRFSISWSRVLPKGIGEVNEQGVQFYSDLIDELLAHGIEPWVTIYHWDLPATLNQDFGGWLGPKDAMVGAFGNYSRLLFQRFGGRVRNWITLNEPWCQAYFYTSGWPSRKRGPGWDTYAAAHNQLLAHAEAVGIYRREFQTAQGGKIGITLNVDWSQPLDPNAPADVEAAQRARDFQLGWFADPIYFGDYPERMRSSLGERLPTFTPQERSALLGSNDFFGLNHYFTNTITPLPPRQDNRSHTYDTDLGVLAKAPLGREKVDNGNPVTPEGFREVLLYVQERYKPVGGIMVTENGFPAEPADSRAKELLQPVQPKPYARDSEAVVEDWDNETYEDARRVGYFGQYLSALHAAREDGADVRAYFAWSLFDNLEWFAGYSVRFGIVRVDFETQKRIIKRSGRFYADVIERNGLALAPTAKL